MTKFIRLDAKKIQCLFFAVVLLAVANAPLNAQTVQTLTSGTSWVAPTGVTSVQVECWGGGGGGGGAKTTGNGGGSGGGGGAYSKIINYSVTAGSSYTYSIGAAGSAGSGTGAGGLGGNTWFVSTSTVLGAGGSGGGANGGTQGAAGATGSCVGTTIYSGGVGGTGSNSSGQYSGSGGGAGGSTAQGGNGSASATGGTGASVGGGNGAGGETTNANNPGTGLTAPGGGGGGGKTGAGGTSRNGSAGAAGQITLTYTINLPMTYTSSTTTGNSSGVAPGTSNQEIIGVQIVTAGGSVPAIVLNSLTFSLNGSTSAVDIGAARIWYTGTSSTFPTGGVGATQFGTDQVSPALSTPYTITPGTGTTLAVGTNYFWIVYDISSSATIGDVVHADCTNLNLTVNSVTGNQTPSVTNPTGSRTIAQPTYCTVTIGGSYPPCSNSIFASFGWIGAGTGNSNNLYNGGTPTPTCNSTTYTDLTANSYSATQGTSVPLNITMSDPNGDLGTYNATIDAFADWNYTGTLSQVSSGTASSTAATMSAIPIPSNAIPGPHRLRVIFGQVILSSLTITSCGTSGTFTAGQAMDFTINVQPSGSPMVYTSSTTTQNDVTVQPNTTKETIVGLQVVTSGTLTPLNVSSITFTSSGTTAPATDISSARIYYTGGVNAFSTTTQFGTDGHDLVASPNGSYTVTPTAATTLAAGTNYFWCTYDIPSGAVIGDFAEAAITSVVVSGATKTPASIATATQLINPAYCTPAASNCTVSATSYGYISNVQLGTINNSSSSSNCGANSQGYSDYASSVVSTTLFSPSRANSFSVTRGTDGTTLYWFDIYIDLNNDGVFTDANDNVFSDYPAGATSTGSSSGSVSSTFNIPSGVSPGNHRIRFRNIRANNGGTVTTDANDPCATENYGEAEDYLVNIQAASAPMAYSSSTVTQVTGTVYTASSANPIIGIQVVTTGATSPLSATLFNFSPHTSGVNTNLSDIANATIYYTGTSSTFATTALFGSLSSITSGTNTISGAQALTTGTNYFWLTYDVPASAGVGDQIDAKCTAITLTDATHTDQGTQDPAGTRTINSSATYCVPSSTNNCGSFGAITNVNITGLTTLNNSSGCATTSTAYSDFTSSISPLYLASPSIDAFTVTRAAGDNSPYYVAIWIDLNNNGLFDDGTVYQTPGAPNGSFTPETGNITIPSGVAPGLHRMRIRNIYYTATGFDPCNIYQYGEAEDYLVNIVSPCSGAPANATNYSGVSNNTGSQITVSFTRGSGSNVLVVASQSANPVAPVNGTDYSGVANAAFATSGAQIGGSGTYVVYAGTGNSVVVTNLNPGTTYYFGVYEYNTSPDCYASVALSGTTTALNPMYLSSSTTAQITGTVAPGSTNQQIIQVQVLTTGATVPALTTNSITFNTNGSSSVASDITNVKIYYTGISSTFATTSQFGSTVTGGSIPVGTNTYTLSGSQALAVGTNYFWITYDVPSTAISGDYLDAECTNVNLSSSTAGTINSTPLITAPAGNRQISVSDCSVTNDYDGLSCSDNGGANSACTYTNVYGYTSIVVNNISLYNTNTYCVDAVYQDFTASPSNQTVSVDAGATNVPISISRFGSSGGGSYMYAFVDWNDDGSFTSNGSDQILGVDWSQSGGINSGNFTFNVPATAKTGYHRMRFISSYDGACSAPTSCIVYQGQVIDFSIIVHPSSNTAFNSALTTQANTSNVFPGSLNQVIMGLEVTAIGYNSTLNLTNITFNTTGSTNAANDLVNAKIYYTGLSNLYSTSGGALATQANPNGTYSVALSQALSPGINYFWLSYDISPTGTLDDIVNAQITQITVGGTNYRPSIYSSGNRKISGGTGIPILYFDFELNSARSTTYELTPETQVNSGNSNITLTGGGAARVAGLTYYGSTNTGSGVVWNGGNSNPTAFTTPADYAQLTVNTTGFKGITIRYDIALPNSGGFLGGGYNWDAINYSTDGGNTWAVLASYVPQMGYWYTREIQLPSTCDNISTLEFQIYGYAGASNYVVALDNLYIYATSTTDNAGTLTLPNFGAVYAGVTSGNTGLETYDGFIVRGSGTTVNMTSSNVSLSTGLYDENSGTFNFGTAATPSYLQNASGEFVNNGSTVGITDASGIAASAATGNVLCTGTRYYGTTGNYNYFGNTAQITGNGLPASVNNLTINNAAGVSLTNAVTVNGTATLTTGVLKLSSHNLTIGTAGTLSVSSPSTSKMVQADGGGQLVLPVTTTTNATYLFPVGDATPNYTPVNLTFTSNSSAGTVGVNVTNSTEANMGGATSYLTRYWTFSNSGLTNYSYTGTFAYPSANIVGTETSMKLSQWTGSAWSAFLGSSAVSNLLTETTPLTQTTGPLTGDFTGRLASSGPSTWIGPANGDWNTGTNWTPTGVPNSCAVAVIINSGGSPVISTGDMSVGNITLGDGATLTLTGHNLNVCGSWTGGTLTNSSVAGTGTTILNGSTAQVLNGNTQFNILQIDNASGVSIASRANVSIGTGLQLNTGQLDASIGTLTLLSTAANSNSYIDDFTGGFTPGTIKGNVVAQRYVPVSGYNQHFITSPLGSVALSQVGASGPDGEFIIPTANCDETVSAGNSPYGSVFTYIDGHQPSGACMLGNWRITTAGNMVPAQGYSTYLTGNSTLSVTGTANTGNTQVSTYNSAYPAVSTLQQSADGGHGAIESGWALVGNPYPSSLDLITTRTGYDAQVQIWQTSGPFSGTWQAAMITGEHGTAVIPPFQAFMVHVSTGQQQNNYTYNFYQSERTRTTNLSFYRTQSQNTLQLTLDYNGMQDMTTVSFNPSATYGFDAQYDADKQDGSAGRPTLYTFFPNSTVWYAINTVPSLTQTAAIPVGLRPENNATMTITAQGIESFDATTYIYLEDKQTGTWTNMRNGAYTFNTTPTDDQQRFVLHFTPPTQILTTDATCEAGGMINIIQPGTASWNYAITDANNATVSSGSLNSSIPVNINVEPGIYTLTLTDNTGYTVVKNIQVGGAEVVSAAFSSNLNTAQVQQNITFTGNAPDASAYNWNFGDGSTANGQTTVHNFQQEGTYNVLLNVSSPAGCTSSTTHSVTITSRSVTGVSNLGNAGDVTIWSNENRVFIDFSNLSSVDADISMYNVLGQLINHETFGRSTLYSREITNLEAAYVIVKVINDTQVTTKKVFIANNK